MSKKVDQIDLIIYNSINYSDRENIMKHKFEIEKRELKLFGLLPILRYEHCGGRKVWRFLHLPIFKVRYLSKGLITKYYVLNVPVLQKVRKFL